MVVELDEVDAIDIFLCITSNHGRVMRISEAWKFDKIG